MNAIHTDIVEVWNLKDKAGVSSPHSPYDLVAHRDKLVSVQLRIQREDVSLRQRLGKVDPGHAFKVSVLRMKQRRDV